MEIQHDNDQDIQNFASKSSKVENYKSFENSSAIIIVPRQTPPANAKIKKFRQKSESSKNQQKKLKQLLLKNKVQLLINNFCHKIKRTIVSQIPVQMNLKEQSIFFFNRFDYLRKKEAFLIPNVFLAFFSMFEIILATILLIIYSLLFIFSELESSKGIHQFQMLSLVIYLVRISIQCNSKSIHQGKILTFYSQIITWYLKNKFFIDLLNILVLLLDIFEVLTSNHMSVLRIVFFVKFINTLSNLQMIQQTFITTFYRQQYFDLFLVFLSNFSFAHILSILLNAMALLNSQTNWLITHRLQNSTWYQKYIWGYYWGTTTMLTVGFGDFAATNLEQAICLTLIEMVSCITLAYNINCVGTLLTNLRNQKIEKSKNYKIFHQINKIKKLSPDVEKKIVNHIQQNSKMKEDTNFEQQQVFIKKLPEIIQSQYLREVNRNYFTKLPLIKRFTQKMQNKLALKIQNKIIYPEQIIFNVNDLSKFSILTKGVVGFCGKKRRAYETQKIIQKIQVDQHKSCKLLTLDFIKSKRLTYIIKSIKYSVISYLEQQPFIQTLKQSHIDYQHYCLLRDQQDYLVDQNEIHPCQYCNKSFHTNFNCPKLHYIPLKQHVIRKYLKKIKQSTQPRKKCDIKKIKKQFKNNLVQLDQVKKYNRENQESSTINASISNLKQIFLDLKQQKQILKTNRKSILSPNILANILKANEEIYTVNEDFWQVQCDKVCQWKYYFRNWNIGNIELKPMPKKKSKKRTYYR